MPTSEEFGELIVLTIDFWFLQDVVFQLSRDQPTVVDVLGQKVRTAISPETTCMSSTTPNATDGEKLPVPTDANEWETVGRELLQARLEHVNDELIQTSFREAAVRIGAGETLRQSEIQAMRQALERAEQVLKLAAEVSPDASPRPDLWEYLDDRARQEYIHDVTNE